MTASHRCRIEDRDYVLVTNVGTGVVQIQHSDGTGICAYDRDPKVRVPWRAPGEPFQKFLESGHLEHLGTVLSLGFAWLPNSRQIDVTGIKERHCIGVSVSTRRESIREQQQQLDYEPFSELGRARYQRALADEAHLLDETERSPAGPVVKTIDALWQAYGPSRAPGGCTRARAATGHCFRVLWEWLQILYGIRTAAAVNLHARFKPLYQEAPPRLDLLGHRPGAEGIDRVVGEISELLPPYDQARFGSVPPGVLNAEQTHGGRP